MPRADRHVRVATLVAGAMVLGACAVGPDYREPDVTARDRFAAGTLVSVAAQGDIEREWGGSSRIRCSTSGPGRSGQQPRCRGRDRRLREARAQRRERLFDFVPSVTGTASYDKGRQSAAGTPGLPPGTPIERDYELYDAGFDAAWELDLFGRVRRLNESARAAEQAADAARNDVVLSVIAEVARNYFELRGAQSQLAVAQGNAGNQSRALQLVTSASMPAAARAGPCARDGPGETTLARVPPSRQQSIAACVASLF